MNLVIGPKHIKKFDFLYSNIPKSQQPQTPGTKRSINQDYKEIVVNGDRKS